MTPKSKIPKKRGQLGLDEEKFIRDNIGILEIEDIADKLNRSVKPIERYLQKSKIGTKTQMNNKTIKLLGKNYIRNHFGEK